MRARFWTYLALFLVLLPLEAVYACDNAGGMIVVHDAGIFLGATDGSIPVCSQGVVPASCAEMDTRIDGANDLFTARIFKLYAAFIPGSSPRLMGVAWGIQYSPGLHLIAWGKCGDFELPDSGWPGSGLGNSVTWNVVQLGLLTPIYWFAGYNDPGSHPIFQPTVNPSQGGKFGNDSVGCDLDDVVGYGKLGFDTDGTATCPGSPCTVPGTPVPASPVCGSQPAAGDVILSWSPAVDAATYDYRFYNNALCSGTPLVEGNTTGTSITWSSPVVGLHSWCVRARNNAIPGGCQAEGIGAWSACCSFEVVQPTPVEQVSWGRLKSRYKE